jgi:hypothetical protein
MKQGKDALCTDGYPIDAVAFVPDHLLPGHADATPRSSFPFVCGTYKLLDPSTQAKVGRLYLGHLTVRPPPTEAPNAEPDLSFSDLTVQHDTSAILDLLWYE